MKINRKKSAIVPLDPTTEIPNELQCGFPVQNNYKYLGLQLNNLFDINFHFTQIQRKINYIRIQLLPITLRGNFKLNNNLFKTFIMPQFRLAMAIAQMNTTQELMTFEKHLRLAYKRMMHLPQSTPTELIERLTGKFTTLAEVVSQVSHIKITAHSEFRSIKGSEKAQIQELKRKDIEFKVLPNELLKAVQLSYSTKCKDCDVLLNSTHLKEKHQLRFSLYELLDRLQSSRLRRSAKTDLKRYTKLLEELSPKRKHK